MSTCYVCECRIINRSTVEAVTFAIVLVAVEGFYHFMSLLLHKYPTISNAYREHIILNSIGGKLISSSIICQSCAPEFDSIDTSLSNQLNFFGLMLNIKRDRGENPPVKARIIRTGDEISLNAGGKPVLIRPIIKENQHDGSISIGARDRKEMRIALKGLKRKYSFNEDIEALLNQANSEASYFDEPVNYNLLIDSEKQFRAICKMIVNFYMHKNGNREQILHLIPYIKNGRQQNCVWYYYPFDNFDLDKEPVQILHQLFIKANSKEKLIYGFVELFSTFKFLILMSDKYIGDSLQYSYCFDVLARTPIASILDINLSRDSVLKIVESREHKLDELKSNLNKLMLFIKKKQADDCISHITQKAIDTSFDSLADGSVPSNDIIRALIENVSEEFAKFFHSQIQFSQENFPTNNNYSGDD